MYFVWRSNTDLSNTFMHVSQDPDGLEHEDWITGNALLKPPPIMTLTGDDDSPIVLSDVVLTGFDLPILSPKAISVLDKSGVNNIEYFPVQIRNWQNSEIEKSYKIANIVGLVSCLDRKNSNYNTFPEDDTISWLQQYSIFTEKILPIPPNKNKPLIFRLGEFPYHVLAHKTIKAAFKKEGITGSEFILPEDYV
jgi:hypothetical protein